MNPITQTRIALNQGVRNGANKVYDGLGDVLTKDTGRMRQLPEAAFGTGIIAGAIIGWNVVPESRYKITGALVGAVIGEISAMGPLCIDLIATEIDWKNDQPRMGWKNYQALVGEKNANEVPQYRAWKETR